MSAPELVCTPGGDSDNSYVTVAEADSYFAVRMDAELWRSADPATKVARLIEATQLIEETGGARRTYSAERQVFYGCPYRLEQALHFPRDTDYTAYFGGDDEHDDDGEGEDEEEPEGSGGGAQPSDWVVPEGVQRAVCEQALWLLQQKAMPQLIDHAQNQGEGIRYLMADGIILQYAGTRRPFWIAPRAWTAIDQYRIRHFQAA